MKYFSATTSRSVTTLYGENTLVSPRERRFPVEDHSQFNTYQLVYLAEPIRCRTVHMALLNQWTLLSLFAHDCCTLPLMQDDKLLGLLALAMVATLLGGVVAGVTVVPVDANDTRTQEVTQDTSQVRAFHAAPGLPDVDVFVNGDELTTNLTYTEASPYQSVEAGSANVTVVASESGEVLFQGNVTFQAEERHTVIGGLSVDENGTASFQPNVVQDDYSVPGFDNSAIRFVHAVPDAGAVDVTLVDENGTMTTIAQNVSLGEAGAYVTVSEGDYTVQLRESTGNETDNATDGETNDTTETETSTETTTETEANETTTETEANETTTEAEANETTTEAGTETTTEAGTETTTETTEPAAPDGNATGDVLLEVNVTLEGGTVYSAFGAGLMNASVISDGGMDDGETNETTTETETSTETSTETNETETEAGANETTTMAGTETTNESAGEDDTIDAGDQFVDTGVQVVLIVDAQRPNVDIPDGVDTPTDETETETGANETEANETESPGTTTAGNASIGAAPVVDAFAAAQSPAASSAVATDASGVARTGLTGTSAFP